MAGLRMLAFVRTATLSAFLVLLSSALPLPAQWLTVPSPTKNDLLSVDSRDQAVWASGQDGTVVHSADKGQTWQLCAPVSKTRGVALIGIAAIDASTAITISSGKGQKSNVYRTTDGCMTWQVAFENPEESSSFDALRRVAGQQIYLLGEPVNGKFPMYLSQDGGRKWFVTDDAGLDAAAGESASETTIATLGPFQYFGTRASTHPRLHFTRANCPASGGSDSCPVEWTSSPFPAETSQLHAVGVRLSAGMSGKIQTNVLGIASDGVRAASSVSLNGGSEWLIPVPFPLLHPVAVAFVPAKQLWIAVGSDGTATSDAGGKHWVKNWVKNTEAAADGEWSSMSLPFAVGTAGRIGRLDIDKLH